MNTSKSHFLRVTLTAVLFILCLAERSHAIDQLQILVSGYEDQRALWITNGTDVVQCEWASNDHDITFGEIYVEDDTDVEGYPIPPYYRTVEYWVNPRTGYTVSLPDAWLGRNVSFSNNGADWTPMYPLLNASDTVSVDMVRSIPTNPGTNTTVQGNNILTGQWWNEPNRPVFTISSWDSANPYWPAVGMDFLASASNSFFRWLHPPGLNETAVIGMELNHLHILTLFGRTNNNTIAIDPEGGRISINGATVVTNSNALSSLAPQFLSHFVGKSPAGVNLALPGATLRSQSGLPPQLLLGAQNDSQTNDLIPSVPTDHTQGVLIVGAGTQPPTNGLRILDDGTVLIQPKGDLLMHSDFKKGPTP